MQECSIANEQGLVVKFFLSEVIMQKGHCKLKRVFTHLAGIYAYLLEPGAHEPLIRTKGSVYIRKEFTSHSMAWWIHQFTYIAAFSLFWNTNMAMTVIDFLELLPWVNGIMRLEKLQEIISLVFSFFFFFFFHFRLIINYFCACPIIILFVMCIESEYV